MQAAKSLTLDVHVAIFGWIKPGMRKSDVTAEIDRLHRLGGADNGSFFCAVQFGEGSFDKGMYLKIPFDVLMTTRTGDWANLVYQPLTRDGGAKLNRSFQLYETTRARSKRDTGYRPFKP